MMGLHSSVLTILIPRGVISLSASRICSPNFIHAFAARREYATGFKLTELKDKLERIGIKHILVHFDCCHAGGIFLDTRSVSSSNELVVERMCSAPVVQAVTAVTADEQAIEEHGNGLFTRTICDKLASGEIFEKHGRSHVTGAELLSAVCADVMQRAHQVRGKMTPMHKDILSRHGGDQCAGQMLFSQPA